MRFCLVTIINLRHSDNKSLCVRHLENSSECASLGKLVPVEAKPGHENGESQRQSCDTYLEAPTPAQVLLHPDHDGGRHEAAGAQGEEVPIEEGRDEPLIAMVELVGAVRWQRRLDPADSRGHRIEAKIEDSSLVLVGCPVVWRLE